MLILLLVLAFAAGIWTAMTPGLRPFMDPAMATLMIVAGAIFMSPLMVSATPEYERRARWGRWSLGLAMILQSITHFVPASTFRWILAAAAAALLVPAFIGLRKRPSAS